MAELRIILKPGESNVTHQSFYSEGSGYAKVLFSIGDALVSLYGDAEDMDRALKDLADAWTERDELLSGNQREADYSALFGGGDGV